MSGPTKSPRPIIVRRGGESGGHGHHGGAWKVAYADFVTAMMAFFLLLWLVSSANQATLRGLAEYFSDATVHTGPPGGAGGVLDGFSMIPNPPMTPTSPFGRPLATSVLKHGAPALELNEAPGEPDGGQAAEAMGATTPSEEDGLDAAAAAIVTAVEASPELQALRDSLVVEETEEGLRVQLLDRDHLAMFPVGSDAMYPHTRRLIEVVVAAVAKVGGRLSIRGHTDALPFAPGAIYDNWALSSDRANATRRAMVESGLDPSRVAEVVGKGDAEPLIPNDVHDPRNRRISIVLLRDRLGGKTAMPSRPVAEEMRAEERSSGAGRDLSRSEPETPAHHDDRHARAEP